ncbi:MFS transporter [Rickettsia endosymbiont of Polydrusus tereticollis]|uniref:MFS transporter n=1 Tax=Rickettsia endosymbiont of Polydrusus tereticollis TaxID=3066251 RepID=UPI003132F7B2
MSPISHAISGLRETPDFVDAKRHLKRTLEKANIDEKKIKNLPWYKEKGDKKTILAFFLADCAWPIGFYLTYIYCGGILKNSFGYTAEQVIHQNLLVAIVELLGAFLLIYLSCKIYPLKILKIKFVIFSIFVVACPYLFYNISTPLHVFLIQSFIMLFGCFINPAFPIFYKHLPILRRFTYVSFSFAVSRASMYVITSFGIIYLIEYFSHWGLLIILLPVTIGFWFGLYHFEKLEKAAGSYPQRLFDVYQVKG